MTLNGYYVIETPQGERVAKALNETDGIFYGVYSPSDFAEKGDNQSQSMNNYYIADATKEQETEWNNWYI